MNPPKCDEYATFVRVSPLKNVMLRTAISFHVTEEGVTTRLDIRTWELILLTLVFCSLTNVLFFECLSCCVDKLDRGSRENRMHAFNYNVLSDEVLLHVREGTRGLRDVVKVRDEDLREPALNEWLPGN